MTIKHVQFQDETQQIIISEFSVPQNPDAFPNQGDVEDSDPRYKAFAENFS